MIVQRRAYQLQKLSASYGGDYKYCSSSQLELASKAISLKKKLNDPSGFTTIVANEGLE